MEAKAWIAIGCVWAAVGVALGAFGAHALKDTLRETGQLANWQTAVRYQMWHALALVGFGLLCRRRAAGALPGWLFLTGSLLFSGSIYLLAFDLLSALIWPLTPLGGVLLIAGWLAFAISALRSRPEGS
jgi:uncharacterized membrane protein YgdD (TMEM256/DUF423 family)